MEEILQAVIRRLGLMPQSPATEDALRQFEVDFDLRLPEEVRRFYKSSDGLALGPLDAEILSLEQIADLLTAPGAWFGWLGPWRVVPVLDDYQSNYAVLACAEPLSPRVLHYPHDDGPRVLYRSFGRMPAALAGAAAEEDATADLLLHDTPGDYGGDSARSARDLADGEALVRARRPHDATDPGAWALYQSECRFGVWLLDDTRIDIIARKLEDDASVRRDVLERLRASSSPAAAAVLARDRAEMDVFVARAVDALRAAGNTVEAVREDCVYTGGRWLDLAFFFHRRSQPDAPRRLLQWNEDLSAGRNPHDRAAHYLSGNGTRRRGDCQDLNSRTSSGRIGLPPAGGVRIRRP